MFHLLYSISVIRNFPATWEICSEISECLHNTILAKDSRVG